MSKAKSTLASMVLFILMIIVPFSIVYAVSNGTFEKPQENDASTAEYDVEEAQSELHRYVNHDESDGSIEKRDEPTSTSETEAETHSQSVPDQEEGLKKEPTENDEPTESDEVENEPKFFFSQPEIKGRVAEPVDVRFYSDQKVSEAKISMPKVAQLVEDELESTLSVGYEEENPTEDQDDWIVKAENAQNHFTIPVVFDEAGSYEIAMEEEKAVLNILPAEEVEPEEEQDLNETELADQENQGQRSSDSNNTKEGVWGSVPWNFDENTKKITLHGGEAGTKESAPWKTYKDVEEIIVLESIELPEDCWAMFSSLSFLKNIHGSELFDTSNVTRMSSMFYDSTSLEKLDVSTWDVSNVTDMGGMFGNTKSLTELDVSNWDTSNLKMKRHMFWYTGLRSIKLGKRSIFTGDDLGFREIQPTAEYTGRWLWKESLNTREIITFADRFFLSDYDGTRPGTYTWEPTQFPTVLVKHLNTEGKALVDHEVIKGFLGDPYATEPKELIGLKAIKPENASGTFTEGQTEVIYVYEQIWGTVPWLYDDETKTITLYGGIAGSVENAPWKYYKEVNKIELVDSVVLPEASRNMFTNLKELVHVQGAHLFDTSEVTDMRGMFSHLPKLESLDINHWNTSNVTDMYGLFWDATGLQELDLSDWNVTKVDTFSGMFSEMNALRELNLSGWNTKMTTNIKGGIMFSGTTSLEKLTLGPDFVFPSGASLPNIQVRGKYTGRWALKENLESGGEVIAFDSSKDFMDRYEGQYPGSYIWETIVLPVDPLDPEKEVNPENKPDLPINQGYLSIDFVSQINFGSQAISTKNKQYYANPQGLLNDDGTMIENEDRPNYVQVSDRRSNSEQGWQLAVTQKDYFKNEKGQKLNGAKLILMNQAVIGKEGKRPSVQKTTAVELDPGKERVLMGAKQGEGKGTWIYRFGDQKSAGKSITLEVPAGANPEATSYSTTLIWELISVPDPVDALNSSMMDNKND